MTKVYTAIPVGDAIRHRVVLTDVPSSPATKRTRQHAFLQEVVVDGVYTGLFGCGPVPFDTMAVAHNGEAWEVVMEAMERTVKKGTP